MDAITYSAARANLATTMDRVCNDHEALIITRNGEQSVVMLSLEDFQAHEEGSGPTLQRVHCNHVLRRSSLPLTRVALCLRQRTAR